LKVRKQNGSHVVFHEGTRIGTAYQGESGKYHSQVKSPGDGAGAFSRHAHGTHDTLDEAVAHVYEHGTKGPGPADHVPKMSPEQRKHHREGHVVPPKGGAPNPDVDAAPWDPQAHPRKPKGPGGGQFSPGSSSPAPTNEKPLQKGMTGQQVTDLQKR